MNRLVLILDDSLTVRMDLHEAFTAAGFETTPVATQASARLALSQKPHALVVLDVLLPDGDGIDFLKELKGNPDTVDVPVILLSSEQEVADRVRGLSIGADDYMGKPYDRERLIERARELVAEPSAAAPTVLVIDDSRTFREAMRQALTEAGYDVVLADSGEEGLRLAAVVRPDVVLMDGQLPGISGRMALSRMRQQSDLRRTPCLLLTASEEAADELSALDAGADAYVRKSEGMPVILARLGALLRSVGAPAAIDPIHAGTRRLLVIDDSPTYLHLLAGHLRADGYEVVLAQSGEEALARLEAETFDCILLDLIMPGMSGPETCRVIKSRPAWREIPLAMHSVTEAPAAVIDGLNAGADDFIVKTDDFEVIKGRVRAQLRRKHFEDENRRIREELLHKEIEAAEARAAAELAEARARLLADLERKNVELAEAKLKAEEATQAKSQFLAYMSHEIRTPLNALLGGVDLLASTPLDEVQQKYVALLNRSGETLLGIVNDILDLSKIEADRIELEQVEFELTELVDKAMAIASVRAQMNDVTLHAEIAPDVPAVWLGDPHRLLQVFNNLLGNAIKFTPQGTVRLVIEVELTGALHVAVTDTGPGIPPHMREAIFESFAQAEASTTRRFGGSGLGLAICKRLVELMGGRIWVESQLGEGSTFHFTARLATGQAPGLPARAEEVLEPDDRPLDILLAEDLEDNRAIFEAYLAQTPHRYEFAEDGLAAVARFKERRFDLVFMDMQMPEMDGFEATRAIRRYEAEAGLPATPVIALTAAALRNDGEQCREAGCTAHLTKPIKHGDFLRALARFVHGERVRVEIEADLAPLVPTFLAARREEALDIRRAADVGDMATVRALADGLAAVGGTYGFDGLSAFGAKLSEAAARNDAEAVRRLAGEIENHLDALDVVYV